MTLDLTEDNFEKEVLQSPLPVLVDFWAPWCPPCRLLKPVIEKLADDYQGKVKIAKLNIDESPQIAQNYQVMSIPTLIFFKKRKIVKRLLGAQPEKVISEKLNQLL